MANDFGRLIEEAAGRVKPALDGAKKASTGIEWYPYGTLTSVPRMVKLLEGVPLEQVKGSPLLDLGSADGDLSYLFETLGFAVDAVDFPPANHNHMEGIAHVRQALDARFRVFRRDINDAGPLPSAHYGLMICLGVLYHLENPVGVLKRLAQQGTYLLLSTRVMDRAPGVAVALNDLPLAWLAGAREVNADPTNFWFFTPAGLERLFERCHWRVVKTLRAGARDGADLERQDGRQFYLLESRFAVSGDVVLLDGWHALEYDSFRWTEAAFSAGLRRGARALDFSFFSPDAGYRLQAWSEASMLGQYAVAAPGEQVWRIELPDGVRRVSFRCEDLPARGDGRSLGVVVNFAGSPPMRLTD